MADIDINNCRNLQDREKQPKNHRASAEINQKWNRQRKHYGADDVSSHKGEKGRRAESADRTDHEQPINWLWHTQTIKQQRTQPERQQECPKNEHLLKPDAAAINWLREQLRQRAMGKLRPE